MSSLSVKFQTSSTPPSHRFWWGSCCCSCSCCERGKTKSTPSPKTEVWTLDLGLEFDKKSNAFDLHLIEMWSTSHFWRGTSSESDVNCRNCLYLSSQATDFTTWLIEEGDALTSAFSNYLVAFQIFVFIIFIYFYLSFIQVWFSYSGNEMTNLANNNDINTFNPK